MGNPARKFWTVTWWDGEYNQSMKVYAKKMTRIDDHTIMADSVVIDLEEQYYGHAIVKDIKPWKEEK